MQEKQEQELAMGIALLITQDISKVQKRNWGGGWSQE